MQTTRDQRTREKKLYYLVQGDQYTIQFLYAQNTHYRNTTPHSDGVQHVSEQPDIDRPDVSP